jgi:predicted transcriptional regulator
MEPQNEDTTRRFTPSQTGIGSPLGVLEQSIMSVLWRRDAPACVAEVQTELTDTAYTTVKTTLERLTRKGILTRLREGKAYLYRAALSQEELERRIVAEALETLALRFPGALASYFAAPGSALSPETDTLLRAAIAQKRKDERRA